MKWIVFLILSIASMTSFASLRCEDLPDSSQVVVVGSGAVVTRHNWHRFDVLAVYEVAECLASLKQELIDFQGHRLWRFSTTEDICDGGNVAGSIYSEDLKTPIAHIYDSQIYCPQDWDLEMRAR